MAARKPAKRAFGQIAALPSKRLRARYTGPDGTRHNAPHTFTTRMDAEAWLTDERRLIERGEWTPPADRARTRRTPQAETFGVYAAAWLATRPLKPRTKAHYTALIRNQLAPLAGQPVAALTPAAVRAWHATLDPGTPTVRAHAYSLLRTVLGTAVEDGIIPANPCRIRRAGASKAVHAPDVPAPDRIARLADEMPPRFRAAVLLAAWCGLRFGELAELRRPDVDLRRGVVRVRRGVVRVDGERVVGTPKSAAGVRDVALPPHIVPVLREHLATHTPFGRDALLFPAAGDPARHLAPSSLYAVFHPARERAGLPDLRWHDLRHVGATLAATAGASLPELMARLGHSTAQASLRYQHAAQGRDAEIARRLSTLAGEL